MAHAYNLSTLEAKARKLRLPNQFRVHIMFQTTWAMDTAEIMFQRNKTKSYYHNRKTLGEKSMQTTQKFTESKQMDPILNKNTA